MSRSRNPPPRGQGAARAKQVTYVLTITDVTWSTSVITSMIQQFSLCLTVSVSWSVCLSAFAWLLALLSENLSD